MSACARRRSRAAAGRYRRPRRIALCGRTDVALVDLREKSEREKHGIIPGSLHAPYPDLPANIGAGGMLHELAAATGKRIVFYCAFGERSAMAVQAAQDAGLKIRLPHRGRHRRLEEGRRTARALRGMGVKFELNRDFPRPLGVDRGGKIGPNPHSNRLKDFSSGSES